MAVYKKMQKWLGKIKPMWQRIKFEVRWRWEDIKHEHSAGIPDDPNEPKERPVPMQALPGIFYRALIDTRNELIDEIKYCTQWIRKEKPSSESIDTTPVHPSEAVQPSPSPHHEFIEFQRKFQHFVRTRFLLIQTSIRQFLIGYNEGMGRDLDTYRKKKDLGGLVSDSELFDKKLWLEKVQSVASGIKKIQSEMHDIADVSNDQLLREDLEKAERVDREDEKMLYGKDTDGSSDGKTDVEGGGAASSVVVDTPPSSSGSGSGGDHHVTR